jgi:hypothetical protein
VVSPVTQTVESAFSFDLVPQSECEPADSYYTLKVSVPGVGVTKLRTFTVPDDVTEAWIGELYVDPPTAGGGGGGDGPITLDSLVDVDFASPADGEVLTYDGYTDQWRNAAAGGGGALDDLSDVNAPTPADGQFLTWTGTEWTAENLTYQDLSMFVLNFLGDVLAPSPTDGDLLVFDSDGGFGGDPSWIAQAPGFTTTTGGGQEAVQAHGSTGATETIDLANGNVHTATLDADCTITFTGATNAKSCSFELVLTQDGTGSRTVTWPGSVKWAGGTPPTLSTAADAVDRLVFSSVDGGTTWYGNVVGLGYA